VPCIFFWKFDSFIVQESINYKSDSGGSFFAIFQMMNLNPSLYNNCSQGDKWERRFMANLTKVRSMFPAFEITASGNLGWKEDERLKLEGIKARLVWSAIAVISVAVATAWESDWVSSRHHTHCCGLIFFYW
jgi:hypothetical protein